MFLATDGLTKESGETRCFDTPITNTLEHHYMPDDRRVLDAIEHVATY